MRLSARNQLAGTVRSVKEGIVTAEVVVALASGQEIVSVITLESVRTLGIKPGARVTAIIKSTEVLLATDD
jgi:molybdate transport system regulatory protein